MTQTTLRLVSTDIRLSAMTGGKQYFLFRRNPAAVMILPVYHVLLLKLVAQPADRNDVLSRFTSLQLARGGTEQSAAARFDKAVAALRELGVLAAD